MTREVYRSANGKPIDMGALRLQNEKTRAVGNMRVNARGDEVNENNQIIRTKAEQVTKQYKKQTKEYRPTSKSDDQL
jgi:hypothetical protein